LLTLHIPMLTTLKDKLKLQLIQ